MNHWKGFNKTLWGKKIECTSTTDKLVNSNWFKMAAIGNWPWQTKKNVCNTVSLTEFEPNIGAVKAESFPTYTWSTNWLEEIFIKTLTLTVRDNNIWLKQLKLYHFTTLLVKNSGLKSSRQCTVFVKWLAIIYIDTVTISSLNNYFCLSLLKCHQWRGLCT